MFSLMSSNTLSCLTSHSICPGTLSMLNATKSRTRILPSETMSIIFQHACPISDIFTEEEEECVQMPPFHLKLRLVSTLWYDIVQSTPQLWTAIFLPGLCSENLDVRGWYLRLFLDNSGDLPLTLHVRFLSCANEHIISPIVDEFLERAIHRIQTLRLYLPPRIWLDTLIPKMSQLTVLHIVDHLGREAPLFLPKAAYISRVYLSTLLPRRFSFESPAPSITHLNLRIIPISLVVKLLRGCPNLIEFRCLRPTFLGPEDVGTALSSPLVLNHLSTFTWSMCSPMLSNVEKEVFEYIRLPALKTFIWYTIGASRLELDYSGIALLSRLPKSLNTLHFLGISTIHPPDILQHFRHATDVSDIQISSCSTEFVQYVLLRLLQGTEGGGALFPHLTRICVESF